MNAVSPVALEARAEYEDDENTLASHQAGKVIYDVFLGARSLWMRAAFSNGATIHFRLADAREGLTLVSIDAQKFGGRVELVSSSARFRVHYTIPRALHDVLHFTTWISPSIPLRNPFFPRDLYPVGDGVVHTTQRGPRTGIVYGSLEGPRGATFCYLQNLTALNDYSEATKTTPAGRVGGEWAELGYAPAVSDEHALGADKEFILSDAFIALDARVPKTDGDVARLYLELLATLYCELPKPTPQFRDWPTKSEQTVRDLSFSPQCTYQRDGARFLMPYVGDQEKPPESMVQFTVLMPLIEYEEWTGLELTLTMRLLQNFEKFFNHELGTIVRWLPGEKFGDTGEAGQSHENMDSWYLYHILFNLSRLAALGNAKAREMFRKSLPFAIRVAQRFDYRFPVFFHMETLEIVRAESAPGKGGERDVPGLYAQVMLHAHDLFGGSEYLEEAVKAANSLKGLGFKLGYQMNTTGFAAEAMLQLHTLTGDPQYLDLVHVCLANVFDNMWIWECKYGHAVHYPTFFGFFPLRDAAYLAPYEELEALAKFHDLLKMGEDRISPAARLLIAEYGKYALDRVWHYFPSSLPVDALASKSRNGHLDRGLAVPVEDLQDGWELSGQVGQEIYGSGVAMVYTTRHFKRLAVAGVLLFCDYPIVNFKGAARSCHFTARGDGRLTTVVRLIPKDPSAALPPFSLFHKGKQIAGTLSAEGHLVFSLAADAHVKIEW